MRELILYRAMCDEEFKILQTEGLVNTYTKKNGMHYGGKWFASDLGYISIILNDDEYNLKNVRGELYTHVVKLRLRMPEYVFNKFRAKSENGYVNYRIPYNYACMIEVISVEELDVDKVREIETPLMYYHSSKGKWIKIWRYSKLKHFAWNANTSKNAYYVRADIYNRVKRWL